MRLNLLVVLVLQILMISCSSFNKEDQEKAMFHLRIGTNYLNSGEYPEALSELIQAEKLDDENPLIQNNLGLAYFFRGQSLLAEKHLTKAILLKPEYTDAKNNLGRILIENTKYSLAINYLDQAVKDLTYLNPEKPLMNLGIAYFKLNQYEKSISYLQKSLNIKRDNCIAYSFLGRNYYESKDFTKAADILDKAIAQCKKNQFDEPNYYAALSYYQLGQTEIAKTRLDEIIKIYPYGKYADKAKNMLDVIKK